MQAHTVLKSVVGKYADEYVLCLGGTPGSVPSVARGQVFLALIPPYVPSRPLQGMVLRMLSQLWISSLGIKGTRDVNFLVLIRIFIISGEVFGRSTLQTRKNARIQTYVLFCNVFLCYTLTILCSLNHHSPQPPGLLRYLYSTTHVIGLLMYKSRATFYETVVISHQTPLNLGSGKMNAQWNQFSVTPICYGDLTSLPRDLDRVRSRLRCKPCIRNEMDTSTRIHNTGSRQQQRINLQNYFCETAWQRFGNQKEREQRQVRRNYQQCEFI